MKNRTIILVSHHVQLCAPGAGYIVALDNGRVRFEGDRATFQSSEIIKTLIQSTTPDAEDKDSKEEAAIETAPELVKGDHSEPGSDTSSTIAASTVQPAASDVKVEKKAARKLVEEEKRAVGRIGKDIWITYFSACGAGVYWSIFLFIFILAALSPVLENGWLK